MEFTSVASHAVPSNDYYGLHSYTTSSLSSDAYRDACWSFVVRL